MMPRAKKSFKILYWILLVLLILLSVFLAWLYSGTVTSAKVVIFQAVPLPMALVNGYPLPMKDFLIRLNIAQKTLGKPAAQKAKSDIIKKLIREQEVSQLARQKDVSVSQKQIDQEYSRLAGQTNLQGKANFGEFLAARGLTENILKNNIIKKQLLLNQLLIWFNSQPALSPEAYARANSLIEKIKNGEDMPSLASQFTQDELGKQTGGDMGFVQIIELSPELREGVSSLEPNQAKIVPGTAGLHVIRLEQQLGNQLHLREIFLNTSSFDVWLNAQTKKFSVINLLKI